MGRLLYFNKDDKWYTYSHQDICTAYSMLKKLYVEFIRPCYGESKRCKILYDKDMNLFCIRLDRGRKIKIFVSNKSDESDYVNKFIRLLTISGIVGVPFYKIKISFITDLSEKYLMSHKNLLISKGGSGNYEGFYYLKGDLS